ncbi:hypothetical protein Goklo_017396 [Gossypium klotzschianum]|uniref:Uncharacterized protein n=1 Tax=Gossypium klotzschianum TaxID=34286 RepID=A0A7J8UHZ5_9ROSI|nr:hypothetical protein [Gossypium klotzschianum]
MLKKFNKIADKMDEILATSMRDLGKSGLGYMEKGIVMMKSPTNFMKEANHNDDQG